MQTSHHQTTPTPPRPPVDDTVSNTATLRGRDIVLLAHQRWNTHTTPAHHIVRHLARSNRVLFVETPESFTWLLHEPPARAALPWLFRPLERLEPNLFLYHTPPLLPPGQAFSKTIAATFGALYTRLVRRAIRSAGFERPIFWVHQFSAANVVRSIKPDLTVYEVGEEWAEYTTHAHVKDYLRKTDADMCRCADVVIVPSEAMYESKSPLNQHTHLVPWGVDTELYGQAQHSNTAIPKEIRDAAGPVIGMFGMLDGRRLHVELLTHLATRHPDWTIVLIGRRMKNLDDTALRAHPNIRILDFKPAAELPGYCKGFDVCMIPYMINSFTRSIMPIKLVEYLATGKPIVTTALPAAESFRDVIRVADTIESFEACVIESLDEDACCAKERIARAASFDWNVLGHRKLALAADRLGELRSASSTTPDG